MQISQIMTKNIISCDQNELVSQALSKMRQNKVHQILVMDGKELKGMLLLNDIIKRESDMSVTKVSNMMKPVPRTCSDISIEDAADLIVNANVRALPVVDSELIGVVSETDIISNINVNFDIEKISRPCYSVSFNDNIGKVKNIFVQKNVSRVPIINAGGWKRPASNSSIT